MGPTAAETSTEQWWHSLLRYVDDGKVLPIIGRDLLWIEVNGTTSYLPRLLADGLAHRLGVPIDGELGDDPVDTVVRAYFTRGDYDHERPYSELADLLRAFDTAPSPPGLVKLAELPFPCLVSTTYDSFLGRAVYAAKQNGESIRVIVHSLGSAEDLPRHETADERVVVQLLGRANPSTDYAITDADVLEFVHQFQRHNQPERLLNLFRKQHLLVIGGGFSDWLTRFLLRLSRTDRLWVHKGQRHFFADKQAVHDPRLRSFLEHPLTTAAVFRTDNALEFVDELHRRWQERGGRRTRGARTSTAAAYVEPDITGGIFLSYASEDLEAARRVADTLRQARMEVWFDKTGLSPGDEWDRTISMQIERCFLFVPLLSRHTQVAHGYFYKEWRWAEERARNIAFGSKFAFPVVVDDGAVNPERLPPLFNAVQRVTAPGGHLTPDFVAELREAYRAFQIAQRA